MNRLRLRSDEGLTLPELLVTMALLSVIMSMVLGSTIVVRRTIGGADAGNQDVGQARVAVDAISRNVRAAARPSATVLAVQVARPNEIVLHSNTGDAFAQGPRRIRYLVNAAGELREEITAPSAGPPWTYPATPTSSRVIARGLVRQNIFTYYALSLTTPVTMPSGGLGATSREALSMVQIDVQVRGDSGYSNTPVDIRNRVRLVNQR